MIPGEPFIDDHRQLRLPGYPPPVNLGWRVFTIIAWIAAALVVVIVGTWISNWFMTAPDPDNACIGIPEAEYPVLDYRGFDGAWVYNGAIVGYSQTEDATCLSIHPIDN